MHMPIKRMMDRNVPRSSWRSEVFYFASPGSCNDVSEVASVAAGGPRTRPWLRLTFIPRAPIWRWESSYVCVVTMAAGVLNADNMSWIYNCW